MRVVRAEAVGAAAPLSVAANLMVEQEVTVTTRVAGVIELVQVDRGDEVKKGQPLATLDQREFVLDRRAAEETFHVSQAERDRTEELFRQNLASKAELELKKSRYELALVELERAKLVIDRSVIRAPIDGVVVERFARVGQKVLLEDVAPLFRVTALEPLLARAYLPGSALPHLKTGTEVGVRAVDFPEAATKGRLAFVSPVIDPASGSIQTIVRVPRDARRFFRPGLLVTLEFPGAGREAARLPAACLLSEGGDRGVVFEVTDGRLHRVRVEFTRPGPDTVDVRSGLSPGTMVVLYPTAALVDGATVTVSP